MYTTCINLLRSITHLELYFDTPVKVKKSPHIEVFNIYGANEFNGYIHLMDAGGEWHMLTESQDNYQYIIQSLYQRLKLMQNEATTTN